MADRLKSNDLFSNIQNHSVATFSIIIVLMLLIPVPGAIVDLLMIGNIAISVIILMVVLYTPKSSDFTSFPRVLLYATLYGLGLNIASTRLILTKAASYSYARFPGTMLKAFSSIVTGDSLTNPTTRGLVIGMVIFIILIIIQTVVITKGATRVSEVAARFALDSMSQKMFAVETDLNAGAITDEEARHRRESIRRESDFFSNMDGSSKFVSGNVKAGIFITMIDLVAGIITGMVLGGLNFNDAISIYSRLTIGDGLLSQLPSLLLSFATGLLVTGSSNDETLGEQLKTQFTRSGYVYIITGATVAALSLIPNFPWYLLIPIGALFIIIGSRQLRQEKITFAKKLEEEQAAKTKTQTGSNPDDVSPVVPLDALSIEMGYALLPLVDKEKGAELLERVSRIRRDQALELGLVVPKIRITDNMTFPHSQYCFKLRGMEMGRGSLKMGYYMCMDTGAVVEPMEGEKTTDPAFGMPAIWVGEEHRAEAERRGYAVVDAPTIIATHLTEVIRAHAAEILGRKEVSAIMNKYKEVNPVVVDEVLNTCKYTYGEIEKVLQGLLREQVSIRNIEVILETLGNFGMYHADSRFLIEKVREALGLQICMQYVDQDNKLSVLQVSQSASEMILNHQVVPEDGGEPFTALDPVDARNWIQAVSSAIAQIRERNYYPIILCAGPVRALVRNSISREMPGTVVLSVNEVVAAGPSIKLEVLGEINV